MRDQIDNYIDSILIAVLNTNVHQSIADELNDHILSLVEEKVQSGIEKHNAVTEALMSMGEPNDLGEKFNSVYSISKMPLILWGIMNMIFLSQSI